MGDFTAMERVSAFLSMVLVFGALVAFALIGASTGEESDTLAAGLTGPEIDQQGLALLRKADAKMARLASVRMEITTTIAAPTAPTGPPVVFIKQSGWSIAPDKGYVVTQRQGSRQRRSRRWGRTSISSQAASGSA